MRYTQIPGTNLKPSVICLGTGGLGSRLDRDASFALLDALVDRGGNYLDSAKVYADWLPIERSASEKTIGRWLKARGNREKIIVGTKGAHPDLATMHISRMSAQEIASDVEASLQHLQTDFIDLYWLHRDDTSRPAGEIIESLNVHVKAGKIRYLGCSNWRAERIQAAQEYAALHGLQGFCGDQMMWSLAAMDYKAIADPTLAVMTEDLKAYHQRSGMAAIPYSSQANGLFSKLAQGLPLSSANPMYQVAENEHRLQRIRQLANESGLSLSQLVLGYLLGQPFTTIPIVGCRNLEQLVDSLSAADVTLTTAQVLFLESGVQP
jgi:aryl-alcohol dehydrogenase-like predicted oxidoreductase